MKGIQFVVNEAGEKRAVLIDLIEWRELWEDFYNVLIAHDREDGENIKNNAWGNPITKGSIQAAIYKMQQLQKEVALDKNAIDEMITEGRRF